MKINSEYVMREIAGDTILIPIGDTINNFNGLVILNELAKFIWEKMPQAKDEEELLNYILDEYEVEREVAKSDLDEFLEMLKKENII
ncbi:MAG: PqqD family protein [Intestinibacter bartlettii]|uniref:PqqD family protein n=1 Tax=Intestinibacter bartlettii TaxID=261299 RepID=UPI002913ED06|nr:PqqD family protein [Intestinibacter bartlettii]MDU6198551.1 PqqD family protein [Intestinibacter bartlettii]